MRFKLWRMIRLDVFLMLVHGFGRGVEIENRVAHGLGRTFCGRRRSIMNSRRNVDFFDRMRFAMIWRLGSAG